MDFHKTPEIEGKIQTEVTFFLMQVFLFTYRSQQFCIFVEVEAPVKIMNFGE